MNVFTSIQQINAGVKSGRQILQFVLTVQVGRTGRAGAEHMNTRGHLTGLNTAGVNESLTSCRHEHIHTHTHTVTVLFSCLGRDRTPGQVLALNT